MTEIYECSCPDWKPGIEALNGPIVLQTIRTGNSYQYAGKPFLYCPWCGQGLQCASGFKKGDKALWATGSWWGTLPAEVLGVSESGKRVRIKCMPPNSRYAHFAYVTPQKLTHQTILKP